mmetsp:Transcript_30067/g.70430  ORF Transcript_30067/g.70430 Transcript_30067/m.70430 type:complete len:215 (+) Transcript_30067:995-1639(+)
MAGAAKTTRNASTVSAASGSSAPDKATDSAPPGDTTVPTSLLRQTCALSTLADLATVANLPTSSLLSSTLPFSPAMSTSPCTTARPVSRTSFCSSPSPPSRSCSSPSPTSFPSSIRALFITMLTTTRSTARPMKTTITALVRSLSTRPSRLSSSSWVWFPILPPTFVFGPFRLLTPSSPPSSGRRPWFPPSTSTGSLPSLATASSPALRSVFCS